LRVEGDIHDVESAILAAARGSIMELAWVINADTGLRVGVNPDHVAVLSPLAPDS
jgi:hypothetical protein